MNRTTVRRLSIVCNGYGVPHGNNRPLPIIGFAAFGKTEKIVHRALPRLAHNWWYLSVPR
ncbi:hypothetical protein N7326_04145 [Corynebacterium sp. ES2794-CONJ1]|uniref:hypothetical protein n=1 Tax=unclassified Corynebacterium TaxID=2624378 RepID=UPI002167FEA0|nr:MULTISPECIES: hypothetical protein [unclassified Corynebacterium]MCS4489757.1 hypothetical protein [Corynebacterium sp. ES2775-CONJ]MCS4491234.1 hypothetical protein [Corynebacterium sp. ES2715-CONJ3]MCS4531669.1 hypothetical protein [Corynebacterium sp. ES2730-CONJ]MCU9519065.1 hypothetical protein [Corynebacterium sp. ES2794-CONJ1]